MGMSLRHLSHFGRVIPGVAHSFASGLPGPDDRSEWNLSLVSKVSF